MRAHGSVASASSDPLTRLFINSIAPSMIENSVPRRFRRSSPPPGMAAVSSRDQGIMRNISVSYSPELQ
jgi:hypothetical protein